MMDTIYRIVSNCSFRSLGHRNLVFLPSGKVLLVNDSFAFLTKAMAAKNDFSREELCELLMTDFGLERQEADMEADKTLTLWQQFNLLEK